MPTNTQNNSTPPSGFIDLSGVFTDGDSLDHELAALFSQHSTPTVDAATLGRALAPRYTLLRPLGAGGMGAVFLVEDHTLGERCALKTVLRPGDLSTLLHLKREFRTVAPLFHPNLVKLRELGCVEGCWYLTMEWIRGQPLDIWALTQPEDAVADALAQLLDGLAALHGAGILHRDLKPSNVLVEESSGRVVLLDFGLAMLEGTPASGGGTPGYLAPEAARGEATRASDLYALGCMVHELFAGERPQRGAPALTDAPPWAQALCEGLLRPEPSARLTLAEVRALLGATGHLPTTQPLVGREPALAAIHHALEHATSGNRQLLWVEGESGSGKTRLLREALRGSRVLWGAASPDEHIPLRTLDALNDQLLPYLDLNEPDTRAWAVTASALFPALSVAQGVDTPRERAARAWGQLLARAARDRLLVLVIDDLQWADTDSVEILWRALLGRDEGRLLVIATGTEAEPHLRALQRAGLPLQRIALAPLADQAVLTLLGEIPPGQRQRYLAIVGGNPFVARELATQLHAGQGCPPDLATLLQRKVASLSAPSRGMLELVCVGGRVPEAVLRQACAAQGFGWTEALYPLHASSLLRAAPQAGRGWAVYHERFRHHLLQHLDDPLAHHRALLAAYRATPTPAHHAEAMLRHCTALGDQQGRLWALRAAAEQAMAALAYARSAAHLWALYQATPPTPQDAAQAWQELAHRYSLAGQTEQAIVCRARALKATSDPWRRTQLHAQQGQDLAYARRLEEATACYTEALRPLGLRPLRGALPTLASVLSLRARVRWAQPVAPADRHRQRQQARLWEQLAVAFANTSFLALSEHSERARLAARRAGAPHEAMLSEVLSLTSTTMATPSEGHHRAAVARLDTLAAQLDTPTHWEQATLLAGRGLLQLQRDPDRAATTFVEAYRHVEDAGMADSMMGALVQAYVCNAAVDAGRYDEALSHCARLERRREVGGDARHGVLITATLTRARVAFFRGDDDEARRVIGQAEAKVADRPMTVERQVLLALQMKRDILDGNPGCALDRYQAQRRALWRAGFGLVALSWSRALIDGLDANLALLRTGQPARWSAWQMRRAARRLADKGWPIWRSAGHAALAELAWLGGRPRQAQRHLAAALAQSLAVFEPHYRWRVLCLAEQLDHPGAAAQRQVLEDRFGLRRWPST